MARRGTIHNRPGFQKTVTGYVALAAVSVAMLPVCPEWAHAQRVDRGTSALDLPRPGYEPRNIHFGNNVMAPELRIEGLYDSNIFALSDNPADDYIISVTPRVDVTSAFGNVQLQSDANVSVRKYVDHGRESRTTFGGGTKGKYAISRAHTLSFGGRFDREVESRADPEATVDPRLSPRKIDFMSGDLGYQYRMNRIGISIQGGVVRQNYLPSTDNDRDLSTYRGSLRVTTELSAGKNLYLEGFVNRRDNRLAFDRNGVDRDMTTIGFLAGAGLELANKWRGEMGVGLFRANPDDASLKAFNGFALNGRITWSPDERTAITADVFRGDVGTIRSGASGRIDTRVGLRLDQEIRHNLLFSAKAGVRSTTYRGVATSLRQTTASVGAEVEYLMNRFVSAFANASYAKRYAKIDSEKFNNTGVGIGLRLRY